MLFLNPDQTLSIYDWKFSKEIQTHSFGKKGLGPATELNDCNTTHYSLQLNLYREILEKNPEYDYQLITDTAGIELIKTHFSERTLSAFYQLKLGAAKGDFIRYIALYLFGGVYLDLDASINTDLNTMIDRDNEFVFFINGEKNLEQFCFMIRPRHPILLNMIEEMVNRIEKKEKIIFVTTGPTLFNDVIYGMMTNEKVYDSNNTIDHMDRGNVYANHNQFMGGKLFFRHDNDVEEKIIFRIPESEDMLYENDRSLQYSSFDPTTNICLVNMLF
jgi:hypothetical protein